MLKTYGPNDVLLLASLLATGDESLEGYYGSEMKSELPRVPKAKGDIGDDAMFRSDYNLFLVVEPKKRVKFFEFQVSSRLARMIRVISPRSLKVAGQKTIPPGEGKDVHVLSLMCY